MSQPDATKSGTFNIGGDIPVHRLGFGAMRITGTGIWGEPEDQGGAIATLKRLPHLSVNFIDTAQLMDRRRRRSSSTKRCIPTKAC
jgi:aryl-alcohol dehydrogenase-like predicted oxidoreductase